MWFSSCKTRCNTQVRSFHRPLPLWLEVLEHRTLRSAYLVKHFLCGLAALCLFLGMAGQGQGQPTYSFATLDVPGSSVPSTIAAAINDSGQILGRYRDATFKYHGFLLDNGNYTTVDVPGPTDTFPLGINASGQIVGSYQDAANKYHGFLLDNGNYTTLDVSGAAHSFAQGINASGQIVGVYEDAAFNSHGFLLDNGNYTTLRVPGSNSTRAFGINASGQIVGDYRDASVSGIKPCT